MRIYERQSSYCNWRVIGHWKGLAVKFGTEGSKVVITGRKKDQLDAAAADLANRGIEAIAVVADASIEADCARVVEAAVERFGRIDVLINNAGISMRALFEDLHLDVFRKVMESTFLDWFIPPVTRYPICSDQKDRS